MNPNPAASIAEPRRLSLLYLLLLPLVLLGMLANMNAQTPGAAVAYLPPQGGSGGGQYNAQCGPTENLMGFELRVGDYIDAIRPVCVVTYGAAAIGNQVVPPTWNGGTGGHVANVLCPTSTPIVLAVVVGTAATGNGIVLSKIHLFCGQAVAVQHAPAYPTAVFDSSINNGYLYDQQACPAGQVAVGVHGRGGTYVDAVGLICDAPRMDHSGKALGRVQATTPAVAMSICDRAKDARARNSPMAPALEAQCSAFLKDPKNGVPICDQAQAAQAQHAANAAELVAKCRALGGMPPPVVLQTSKQLNQVLAIAPDPLVAELRKRQPVATQPGFDIGISAAQGQTVWGPAQEQKAASLSPALQEGFKVAVSFSLDRNRNAKLAAVGANIANIDPGVMQARTIDRDVRAWLGFDIASGIFGSPANGGLGNTVAGPGAMQIRNALSLPAQRGFDASMKLHLSRHSKAVKLR